MTDFSPHIVFQWLYTARDAGVIWLASKDLNDCYPVSISLSTLISERSHLSVPEHRTTDGFTNAQHPLNMTVVSKSRQKSNS